MSKHVKSPNDKEIFLSGVFLKKGIYVYFDKSEEDSFSGEAFGRNFWVLDRGAVWLQSEGNANVASFINDTVLQEALNN